MRPEPQKVYVVLAQSKFEGPWDIEGIYADWLDARDAKEAAEKFTGYNARIEEWDVEEE